MEYKPNGYWNDIDNLNKGLEEIIKELGYFPISRELSAINSSIEKSIKKHYGGINNARKEFGFEPIRKKSNYWDDRKNLNREIKEIIQNLGDFPSSSDLNEKNSSLNRAIVKHYGSINNAREAFGFDIQKKPQKYWNDKDNVNRELKILIEKLGHFPSSRELMDENGSLVNAVIKHYDNVNNAREAFGFEIETKPKGYWNNKDNVDRELSNLIEELGHFPITNEIRDYNGSLYGAIKKHHDTLNNAREVLGFKENKRPRGYWQDKPNVDKELSNLIEELGYFPKSEELKESHGSLPGAINKHYKSLNNARKEFGFEPLKKPNGYYKSKDDIKKDLMEIIKELGDFPKYRELKKKNSTLYFAMLKHYGTLNNAREIFGYSNKQIQTKEQLQEFLEENETANKVASLSTVNGYTKDVTSILKELFPDRIQDEENIARLLTERKISNAIYPFTTIKGEIISPIEIIADLPLEIKLKTEDIIYQISIDYYQPIFNKDPKGIMDKLKRLTNSKDKFIYNLGKKIEGYYQKIIELKIPGTDSLN
ncbi:hypothetical protein CL617_02195 [archaeon]|nr:hypothetical protein [archaeon]|tara:strand:- start:4270 stop:5883 length:1614 start_codon:yes stop_codon:yes gene_type:complete